MLRAGYEGSEILAASQIYVGQAKWIHCHRPLHFCLTSQTLSAPQLSGYGKRSVLSLVPRPLSKKKGSGHETILILGSLHAGT